jgi:hypothetical protein
MNVIVLSTSVESQSQIRMLSPVLNTLAGRGQWNFALDDSDRILRIVSNRIKPQEAIYALEKLGFACKELE